MSSVILNNTYFSSGYTVSPSVTDLYLDHATIGGLGLVDADRLTFTSEGTIDPIGYGTGILLQVGGVVTNTGQIFGGEIGIQSNGALLGAHAYPSSRLFNGGTIEASITAVKDEGSANVYNSGLIEAPSGIYVQEGFVANYGTVLGRVQVADDGGQVGNSGLIIGNTYGVLMGSGTLTNTGTLVGGVSGGRVGEGSGTASLVINGSTVARTALIEGKDGVEIGSGSVANYGTIVGTSGIGVALAGIGALTNGSNGDPTALIDGITGVSAAAGITIANFGTIRGWAGDGVTAATGGSIANGSVNDRTALIEGYVGIAIAGGAGTVSNFGTIFGIGPGVSPGLGLTVTGGGRVANGTVNDRTALIEGYEGVVIQGAAGTVTNFATIVGTGSGPGIDLIGGGRVVNGDGADTAARIIGLTGVDLAAKGTVANFGAIDGETGYGVMLGAGGTITNGSPGDHGAVIEGYTGVAVKLAGSVANLGTILGTNGYGGDAVLLAAGAQLTNGAASDTTALIAGYVGVALLGSGASTNSGTILGTGGLHGIGASLGSGARLANGSGLVRSALIEGETGATLGSAATLTNFGTITGLGGTAVSLSSAAAVLVDEAGAHFGGTVLGDGGTLDLAGAGGTLVGLGSSFSGFGLVTVETGASWSVGAPATVKSGSTLADRGMLRLSGALADNGSVAAIGGSLTLAGAVSGTGTLDLSGAATIEVDSTVASGATLVFAGAAETLLLTDPAGFKAGVGGFAAGDRIDLRSFAPGAAETLTFSENAAKTAGTLKVTDGAATFAVTLFGQYVAAGFGLAGDGHGGSSVTYTPPTPAGAAVLAASHL